MSRKIGNFIEEKLLADFELVSEIERKFYLLDKTLKELSIEYEISISVLKKILPTINKYYWNKYLDKSYKDIPEDIIKVCEKISRWTRCRCGKFITKEISVGEDILYLAYEDAVTNNLKPGVLVKKYGITPKKACAICGRPDPRYSDLIQSFMNNFISYNMLCELFRKRHCASRYLVDTEILKYRLEHKTYHTNGKGIKTVKRQRALTQPKFGFCARAINKTWSENQYYRPDLCCLGINSISYKNIYRELYRSGIIDGEFASCMIYYQDIDKIHTRALLLNKVFDAISGKGIKEKWMYRYIPELKEAKKYKPSENELYYEFKQLLKTPFDDCILDAIGKLHISESMANNFMRRYIDEQ